MTGAVVWFTGLPASGKSTLAALVAARVPGCVTLDSDEVRDALGWHGYVGAERDAFYGALGRLAALLARQGHVVLVPATAPRRAHREDARRLAPAFVEVHVATPSALCATRDIKGLYAQARRGDAPALPGVGAAYELPLAPEVIAYDGRDEAAVAEIIAALRAR